MGPTLRRITRRCRSRSRFGDATYSSEHDSVSARGSAHFTVGSLKRRIRHLRIPDTNVPGSGGMTLKGTGRASSFAINQPGTYAVKVTKSLTATATAHGGIGDGSSVSLTCSVRRGQSRTLASLEVIR